MQKFYIHLLNVLIILTPLNITSRENNSEQKKIIWFLGGHMQHLFENDYLKPMLKAGYDLTPLHEIKSLASLENYYFLMADPNAGSLMPFSHDRSGIKEVTNHKEILPQEELTKAKNDFKYIIVFEIMPHQLEYLKQFPKEKLILFLWEPPPVMPQNYDPKNHEIFSKIYTWNDHLVDNIKYFKFYYPALQPMIKDVISFETKKLCTLVAGNLSSPYPNELYTTRRNLIAFYENNHATDFDLYGKWWPATYKTYKGPVDNKINCLKNYKFCFAYENVKGIPGYITEKIFNCFEAGCVPIYLGASNIADYIPKNCFIDRNDFVSDSALYTFMKEIPKEQYEQYIQNIQTYLESKQAEVFSRNHFINLVMQQIRL